MNRQKIDANADLFSLIKIIKESPDNEVVLLFDKKSQIYRNASNLQILRKTAEGLGKSVVFEAENPDHQDYIASVNNDNIDYTEAEINLDMEDDPEHAEGNYKDDEVKVSGISLSMFGFLKRSKSSEPGKKRWYVKFILKPLIVLLIIFAGLAALWWYIPSADVGITVESEVLVKLLNVRASTDAGIVSVEEKSIPAVKIESTESDSQTVEVTGEKETGEKADGEVTLFNKTDDDIKIDKGTVLKLITTDKEGLRYETTEKVEVPAQEEVTTSTDTGESTETEYGQKSVKVRALIYGDEYNVDKEEKFEIDDYDTDELIGENSDDIDGGSKETIKIVTQEDMDSLKRSLEDFMKQKVAESLGKKAVSGQSMQESTIKYEVMNSEFDKKLEEEAEELTLSMTVKGTALAYDDEDLDAVVVELTKTVIPEEYDLDQENPEYEVAATPGTNPEEIDIQVKLRSFITPKLDADKIRSDLTGMGLDQAQDYLNGINNVKQFTITVTPKLPGSLMTLPHYEKNIEIVVTK